jgi:hypothetical protein
LGKISRRKKRPAQNGVQAIFSGGTQGRGKTPPRFSSYEFEDEMEPSSALDRVSSNSLDSSKKRGINSLRRFSRILAVTVLIMVMLTTVVGFSEINSILQHHTDNGSSGTGTSPPVKTSSARIVAPSFYAVSDIAEAILPVNQSYSGTIGTGADDFIIVQIAYSEGNPGNLPDIKQVKDTQSSSYARAASASPGAASNFWEQVWTGRSALATNSTSVTVSPDWSGCQLPCVTSIIITMTIGRYRGVAGVGASTAIAPSISSSSQSVNISATQANSMLVELLSHGAYSSCEIDAPQPGAGQTSRNCFTATTERTELFDHEVSKAQTYTDSYSWGQVEVQRGIYLELKGNTANAR